MKQLFFPVLFFLLLVPITASGSLQSSLNWHIPEIGVLSLSTDANHHPNLGDTKTVVVTVREGNTLVEAAIVSASVDTPIGTEVISFSETGDGNYSYNYQFNSNGTYVFDLNASDSNGTIGSITDYFYSGSYGFSLAKTSDDSFEQGEAASVTLFAQDNQGNPILHASGSLSISYPEGNDFVSGTELTELGGGYYYYNFVAPETTGSYSFTATLYSGSNSEALAGTFSVEESQAQTEFCGNGSCGTGESCSNCVTDCGECAYNGAGGNVNGGPGGSWTQPPETGTGLSILSWRFEQEPMVGLPLDFSVKVSNPGRLRNALLLVKILHENKVVYSDTMLVEDFATGERREVVFEEKFMAPLAGAYSVQISLLSEFRDKIFHETVDTFNLQGIMRYDVSVECLEDLVKIGNKSSARITFINLGNYFKDVQLSWWLEGPAGNEIGFSSLPVALYSEESRNLIREIRIPPGSTNGEYFFKAKVEFSGQVAEGSCSFTVEEDEEYYEQKLERNSAKLDELQEVFEMLQARGLDVKEIETKVSRARTLVLALSAKIQRKDFSQLDEKIAELEVLNEEIEELEKKSSELLFLQVPLGQMDLLIISMLLLLTVLAIILSRVKLADKILGLEEPVKKPRKRRKGKKRKRKKKKDKWKTFEKILGVR